MPRTQKIDKPRAPGDLPGRLKAVIEDFSLSKVARKTENAPSTVWKYLRGTKVPLEFACALADKLDVNPAWLLNGEGAKYLSDVSADTTREAGNLLELVQAMTAVAKKKLGALLGKDHLVRLRELDDALGSYDQVRGQLNQRFESFLGKLLDEYKVAVKQGEHDKARAVFSAIRQISRLCDSEALREKRLDVEAYHEHFLAGRTDAALAIQRKLVFQRLLSDSGEIDSEEGPSHLSNFISSLSQTSHLGEAWRLGNAALGYYQRHARDWFNYRVLDFQVGNAELLLGELEAGLARLSRLLVEGAATPDLDRRDAHFYDLVQGIWLRAHFFSASLPYKGLAEIERPGEFSRHELLKLAIWCENAEAIDAALAQPWTLIGGKGLASPALELGKLSLLALRGKKAKAAAGLKSYLSEVSAEGHIPLVVDSMRVFVLHMFSTQVLQLAGERKRASEELRRAHEALRALPPAVTPHLIWRGMHYRNALRLIPESGAAEPFAALREQAQAFFEEFRAKGYRCFSGIGTGK